MTYRRISAAFSLAALLGILIAALVHRPDAAARMLAIHVESSELRTDKAGGWEFYADPDAVRRNSMDRQRKAMSGALVETAEAKLRRFTVLAVPLGVVSLVSGVAWLMLGRRMEEIHAPPPKPRRKARKVLGRS